MKKALICLSFIVSIIGCKKDDPVNPNLPVTLANIAGNYKMTDVTIASTSSSVYSTFVPACERDDTYAFAASGAVIRTDAGAVCSPNTSASGTFSLTGSTITFLGNTYTVESLTNTNFVVSNNIMFGGATYKALITFTRQ